MSFLRDRPIHFKLTVIILLSALAALLTAGGLFLFADYRLEQTKLQRDINVLAKVLADRSTAALTFDDRDLARDNLAALSLSSYIELGCIYRGSDVEPYARYVATEAAGLTCGMPAGLSSTERIDNRLHVRQLIELDGQIVGEIYLRGVMTHVYQRLATGAFYLASFGIVGLLFAYLLSRWLQRTIAEPMQALARTMVDVGQTGDFSRRARKYDDDEVGSLVDSFNAMLYVIEQQDQELRAGKRNLETQVQARTRELTNAYNELESFSYSVSHDLRAPLRAISGFSDALVEEYGDKLDDQAKDYLQRVQGGTQRMRRLIDDLLALSQATRQKMQLEKVNISELAAETCKMLQELEPQRKIVVKIQPDLTTTGDAQLLKVVLDNLLGNAWKYSRPVAAAHIEFGARDTQQGLAFYVRDNGVGFDAAYQDKLFTPFQRLHDAKEFEGSGIGLATVARVIHRHGGDVWAEAGQGGGATFWFTLDSSPPRSA